MSSEFDNSYCKIYIYHLNLNVSKNWIFSISEIVASYFFHEFMLLNMASIQNINII